MMTIARQIMNYASTRAQPFRRCDLMGFLGMNNISEASAHVLLNRLVEQRKLVKVGYGLYSMPQKGRRDFIYSPTEEEISLAKQLKKKFPFADLCVWKPSVLVPYMRHIPALGMTFVDVARVAMESAFFFLQSIIKDSLLLLNPTAQECERYITTEKVTIVRPLVVEAPIDIIDGFPAPTLEKILVDAVGDKELNFAQGSELYTIYANALEMNDVNMSRLLRYATRRNRKDKIRQIIKSEAL